jgi:hypothetical protein
MHFATRVRTWRVAYLYSDYDMDLFIILSHYYEVIG